MKQSRGPNQESPLTLAMSLFSPSRNEFEIKLDLPVCSIATFPGRLIMRPDKEILTSHVRDMNEWLSRETLWTRFKPAHHRRKTWPHDWLCPTIRYVSGYVPVYMLLLSMRCSLIVLLFVCCSVPPPPPHTFTLLYATSLACYFLCLCCCILSNKHSCDRVLRSPRAILVTRLSRSLFVISITREATP